MADEIIIEYTKEGIRIIHPSGENQFLTVGALYSLWNAMKEEERRTEQNTSMIHDYITEVEKHQ